MVERRLFTVTDTFLIPDRGLVLVPGIAPVGDERFNVGDSLLLKRPDGIEALTTIGGLELLHPNPNHEVTILLSEFGKDVVPPGTEVWSQPRREH